MVAHALIDRGEIVEQPVVGFERAQQRGQFLFRRPSRLDAIGCHIRPRRWAGDPWPVAGWPALDRAATAWADVPRLAGRSPNSAAGAPFRRLFAAAPGLLRMR